MIIKSAVQITLITNKRKHRRKIRENKLLKALNPAYISQKFENMKSSIEFFKKNYKRIEPIVIKSKHRHKSSNPKLITIENQKNLL